MSKQSIAEDINCLLVEVVEQIGSSGEREMKVFNLGDAMKNDQFGSVIVIPKNIRDQLGTANEQGNTLLHRAIVNENIQLVRMLVKFGADLNRRNKIGETPLIVASRVGDDGSARLLLDNLACVHDQDIHDRTALHYAAREGNAILINLLAERGAKLDALDKDGDTPLTLSIENKYQEAAGVLINLGASVDQEDKEGRQPLHYAAKNCLLPVMELLLNNGADPNKKDRYGNCLLQLAAWKGHTEVVQLLIDRGADVNSRGQLNWTPLHDASFYGTTDSVNKLLTLGALVDSIDVHNQTALHKAALEGHTDILKTLIKHGADVNVRDKDGNTPLHLATWNGNISAVETLLQNGSNAKIKNNYGKASPQCIEECRMSKDKDGLSAIYKKFSLL